MSTKKHSGCLTALLIFVLIIGLLIGALYFGFSYFKNRLVGNLYEKAPIPYQTSGEIPLENEQLQFLLTEAESLEALNGPAETYTFTEEELSSDLDGDGLLTCEELEMCTHPYQIDTDGDGLSDSMEVSETFTNPLVYSTSGDNISDGIKYANELDFHTVYSDDALISKEEITIPVELQNVSVTLKTHSLATKTHYIIEELPNTYDFELLAPPLWVSDVQGTLEIPLHAETNANKLQVGFYNSSENKIESLPYKLAKNTVSVQIEGSRNLPLIVTQTKVSSHPLKEFADYAHYFNDLLNGYSSFYIYIQNMDGLFELDESGIGKYLFNQKVKNGELSYEDFLYKVIIVRTKGTENTSEAKAAELGAFLNKVYGLNSVYPIYYYETTKDHFKQMENTQAMYALMDKIITNTLDSTLGEDHADTEFMRNVTQDLVRDMITMKKLDGTLSDVLNYIKGIYDETPDTGITPEEKDTRLSLFGKTFHVDTTFDIQKDAFPFANFAYHFTRDGESYSTEGFCSGFSYWATLLFNTGDVPRSRTAKLSGYPLTTSYNLTEQFAPLYTPRHLYNLPADQTIFSNGDIYEEDLDTYNQEIVNLLATSWQIANDHSISTSVAKFGDQSLLEKDLAIFGMDFNYSNIFNFIYTLEKYLLQNKVVNVIMKDHSGCHAVTIIGMHTNPVYPNIIDLTVYDNNYPNNETRNGEDLTANLKIRILLDVRKVMHNHELVYLLSPKFFYSATAPFRDDPTTYPSEVYKNAYTNINAHGDIDELNFMPGGNVFTSEIISITDVTLIDSSH